MEAAINNIDDLRREIALLKIKKENQEAEIQKHFSDPVTTFNTVFAFVAKVAGKIADSFPRQDIFSLISRLALPYLLNHTFFRKSNFITKALVSFLSQKASSFLSEGGITSIWETIIGLLPKKNKQKDARRAKLTESYQ